LENLADHKLARPILLALEGGPLRAIHPNTLTRTIRWLRDQRYVEHRHGHDIADYTLTGYGLQLVRLIEELNRSGRTVNGDDEASGPETA
jgi:DNA-binding HxlR family transcriptional regulator